MLKVTGAAAITVIAWLAFVGYTAFGGLWMSPVVDAGDTDAFFDYAVKNLRDNNRGAASLLMIEEGVELTVISKVLGHANLSTTADLYGHLTPRIARQTSEVMGAILAR